MTATDAVIVGLVQGLTEFLPVSSTAHLLFAERIFGINPAAVRWIEIATHLGTLGAVLLYYRRDLVQISVEFVRGGPGRRMALLVLLATVQLVLVKVVRLLFPAIREWRDRPEIAALGLIGVGVFLLGTRFARRRANPEPRAIDAVAMGIGQCVSAIVTGWSRSGSTIGTGLFCGLDAAWVARFSFLMSIPAILGGAAEEFRDMTKAGESVPDGATLPLVIAAVVAFASGLAAIHLLLNVVGRGRLAWFGAYCVAAGLVARFCLV